jgi:phytoene synthase
MLSVETRESPSNHGLARSYAYCESLARREAGNFYHAFRSLPNGQRRAMCALYAFLRVADDLSDGPADVTEKRRLLLGWRRGLGQALEGRYSHRLHPAFHHAVERYRIPCRCIEAVLDGVEMDLDQSHYGTFADLERYCYRVASAVGLACIHIWGFSSTEALGYAEKAGIAFQLTNILRDLGEDAGRGRVYLPREDLERFGYTEDELRRGQRTEAFNALMHFQVERARALYAAADPLVGLLHAPGRAVYWVMARTYRGLLDAVEQCGYDVFRRRVRISRWSKLCLAVRALPFRWGWA